jgi:hypothetical protein
MEPLHIQSFTYEDRHGLLPGLAIAFTNCGGWVLDRKTTSPTKMEFQIEIQLRAILNFYAAILSHGIELTRAGHKVFTELCIRRNHQRTLTDLGQVVALRLEISFLEDTTLHSLLISTSHA